MKKRIQRFTETMKHIRIRSVIYALAVLFVTAAIAAFAGLKIHTMQKENLYLRGEVNTQEATMEYNRYLLTRVDIVTMVANTVEDLLESNSGSREIEKYLADETNNVIETLDPGTTGLYGWINGEYIDGAGWVPDAGYVPTERPWYTETIHTGGKITLVDPTPSSPPSEVPSAVSVPAPSSRTTVIGSFRGSKALPSATATTMSICPCNMPRG